MVENGNKNVRSIDCIFVFCCFLAIGNTCGPSEYKSADGHCCPMCDIGRRVNWHCTADFSTMCVPCSPSTYTDEPNGVNKCKSCSVCNAGRGLRVKSSCTRFADTVCEAQEGFYCIDQNKDSCRFAVKHSECRPGQYIRQAGTANTDTVCVNCMDGTYSNGSFITCKPHSKCETEIKPGTMSSDAECGNSSLVAIIVGVILVVVIGVLVTAFGIILKHKRHNTNRSLSDEKSYKVLFPIEETNPGPMTSPTTSGQAPEENNDEPVDDT